MRRFVRVIVVAILAGAVAWFFGLGVLGSTVVVLVLGAVGTILTLISGAPPNRDWPPPPPLTTDGARREGSELSWALRTRTGIVDDRIVFRVRSIATRRLAPRHLDLDNPAHRVAIQRLIGPQVYELLIHAGERRVRLAAILVALDVLDSLDSSNPSTPNLKSEKQA